MSIWELMSRGDLNEKFVLEKLIWYYLWYSKTDLWLRFDEVVNEDKLKLILSSYEKYVIQKMPLEYIFWYVEFFENKFFVNENTLIPRPETEYMILAVTENISEKKKSEKVFQNILIDVGTGCGVLWISVLLQNPDFFDRVYFTDISEWALDVAKRNYSNLLPLTPSKVEGELNVEFLKSDLLDFWHEEDISKIYNFTIVANLPYIPDEMFEVNAPDNVKNYEPKFAFVGGEDGLDLYRRMFGQIEELLSTKLDEKYEIVMFLEMMTRQVDIVRKEFPNLKFEEVKTFHFNIRIVKCVVG